MSKKYINACIRIPMEVLPGGKYEPLTKYAKIFFERCDELPTIGPLDNHNLQSVLRSLGSIPEPELEVESKHESELEVESEKESEPESELEVESESESKPESEKESESEQEPEIESKPRNTTFKNRPGKVAHRYSIKNRQSINLKIEDGLLSSLTSAPA